MFHCKTRRLAGAFCVFRSGWRRAFARAALALLLIFFAARGAAWADRAAGTEACPALALVPAAGPALLPDDGPPASLLAALEQSVAYLRALPPDKPLAFGQQGVAARQLLESLESFRAIVAQALPWPELRKRLAEAFDFYSLTIPPAQPMLVTGYFEPCFAGSLTRTALYRYPLYRIPSDLAVLVGADSTRGREVGRLAGRHFLPYWTRAEIERGELLAGQELVFLADPVEAFLIHVQGSGRVRLPDGTVRRVQYAAKNGRPYRSIGRLLVDEGKMTLDEVTMPRLVEYLREHPGERERILRHNESYIFFRWGDEAAAGPTGSLGRPLTPGRSLALDHDCYPAAGLAFLITSQPEAAAPAPAWKPLTRFVLNQDAGAAIKGPRRADFFWGGDGAARYAAGEMKQPGILYFLLKK